MSKRLKVFVHLVFWLLFIIALILPVRDLILDSPGGIGSLFIFIFPCLLFFYANYTWLVPEYLLKGKLVLYLLWVGLSTLLFIYIKTYVDHLFLYPKVLPYPSYSLYPGIFFSWYIPFILSSTFRILENWHHSEITKYELQQEIKESELLYLKSQMSPHFLFNTLNNIYSLSLSNSTATSRTLFQLKDLMMYLNVFETQTQISLAEEIKFLKSFIALNNLRSNVDAPFLIKISPTVDLNNVHIEPLLLLPFIENAFKHSKTAVVNPIHILLELKENTLYFSVNNLFEENKRKDSIGGIGIKNVKRRLDLLYPEKYTLNIHSDQDVYSADLKLKLI